MPISIRETNLKIDTEPTKYFTGPHKFEMEAWISCAPFERLLNMKIEEASDGRATLTMPFLIDFAQGGGLMHGGALVSLADTAVVMAIKSIIAPKTHFATISLKTKFLYPVKQGIVTAKAEVTNQDGTILQGFATVYDEKKRAVLEFSSTFKMAKERKIRDIGFQDDVDSNLD
jgi:acyl-CoA thioesterase